MGFGWLLALFMVTRAAAETDPSALEFFEAKVRPLLVEHCYQCHSEAAARAGKLKGGLLLDTREGVQKGGDSGLVVVSGKPEESLLVRSVRHTDAQLQMPPKKRLSAAEIATLGQWVALGTPDPREGKAAGKRVIDMESERRQWAFQPPVKHDPPAVSDPRWPRKPHDAFVLAALDRGKLHPVGPASPRDLIRRAALDLTGLPPTPAEVEAFEQDASPEAFARVVDRLLDSPHYGERWGRYWLDVARYADDQGNSFLTPSPTAFRYRDWVVKAFNDDLPYDDFIRLQIAGDLLPGPVTDYPARLAGLGFQGVGPQFRKGAAGEAKAKADELEDRVDTLSRGILGLTVSCARCHDHKFDPIPTRDYYSLAAAYHGAQWPARMLAAPAIVDAHGKWAQGLAAEKDKVKKWTQARATALGREPLQNAAAYALTATRVVVLRHHKLPLDEAALARQEGLHPYFLNRWATALEGTETPPVLVGLRAAVARAKAQGSVVPDQTLREQVESLQKLTLAALAALTTSEAAPAADGKKPAPLAAGHDQVLKALWKDPKAPFFIAETDLAGLLDASAKKELAALQAGVDALASREPPSGPLMPSVQGGGQAMRVFVRGNPENLGEPAPPGFLQALRPPGGPTAEGRPFTRLELAEALADPRNPLTARVFVNRVWHYHFGRGIVATLSNFGKLGSPPSHPELLDTLTVRFIEAGWSIKWLHREIMLSATYQLSSDPDAANLASDPGNVLLWRMSPRRLDIEAWRDSLLSIAGVLDPRVGGPSIDQTTPALKEVAGFNFFTRMNGMEADSPGGRRRTLYAIISRYAPNPTLTLFDFPEPNVTSDQRNFTTVPQQQLFVLNSPFMMEMSRAFAKRLETSATEDAERLRNAWALAYGRAPETRETAAALAFLQAPAKPEPGDRLNRWEQLAHALLSSNEAAFLP
ncbi:MAG: Protein of unknown function DUF1553/DUF1549/Planctomycete cytochrome C [Verrucomicrobia bacterium]|nr:MAG: Protein of unknown function DUF1553/DUF1549/Planctomycete cytochrome C [Verrucomicrobiota bacterium]